MRRVAVLVAAIVLAGCGSNAPTAYSVVGSYLTAIGEGNYSTACGFLDHSAQASLPGPCPSAFARCLPNGVRSLARDQTQQLYANILLTTTGDKAVAVVSGTAVARTIRRVTLANNGGTWRLTSAGRALERCRR